MSARDPLPADIAMGVVLFRPTPDQVGRVVGRFAGRMPVFVFDNGGLPPGAARRDGGAVRWLGGSGNRGIAAALNGLAEAARAAGHRFLFLLDQDADCGVETALALRAARDRLIAAGEVPAVVGPRPAPNPGHKAPRYPARPGRAPHGDLRPVEFLATSGSLIDLALFDRVGPFREDFFIDAVDLEWCFRAWARGHGCWMAAGTAIPHSVGRGTLRVPLLGIAMPNQPPFRMAVYVRNTAFGWRLPHVPGQWKRRQMLYLPVQILLYWAAHGFRPVVLVRLAAALRDGLRGRLGRPADAPP